MIPKTTKKMNKVQISPIKDCEMVSRYKKYGKMKIVQYVTTTKKFQCFLELNFSKQYTDNIRTRLFIKRCSKINSDYIRRAYLDRDNSTSEHKLLGYLGMYNISTGCFLA